MHLKYPWLLSLAASASAFRNTSPFFLASTSDILPQNQNQNQNQNQIKLQTAPHLLDTFASHLSSCPSDYYIIVSQPGVHSADFVSSKATPRLAEKLTGRDTDVKSSLVVNEVVDVLDKDLIGDVVRRVCGGSDGGREVERVVVDGSTGSYPQSFGPGRKIISLDFPMLSLDSNRGQQLSDNDGLLSDILSHLPSPPNYTLLYATSPREYPDSPHSDDTNGLYKEQDPIRMELKRDYSTHLRREDGDGDGEDDFEEEDSKESLFEEYQYLSPGLFMGFLASFFCLMILYVGFSALVSLKVPYAAFERDTSANVQKKQQ